MADRLLRISEVADRLGYDRSHTYALIRQGRFPVPVIRNLGEMRVSERELLKWLEQAGEVPKPPARPAVEPRRRRAPAVASGDTVVPFPG